MSYFEKVKCGDQVFGLVFGLGTVSKVFDDGYYKLMVEFDNDHEVPYTDDGIPGWGKFKEQTLFYKDDICGLASLIDIRKQHLSWTINRAELAYWLAPAFQGKGLISEACWSILEYAFKQLKFHKVTENRHSIFSK